MSIFFWIITSLTILYLYLGFPLILALLAKLLQRDHAVDETYTPTVTLIISAYNEEDVIYEKLENSLALDYPEDKLKIFVVSDYSDDQTDQIVQDFPSHQVQLVRMTERAGKTAGLNRALEQATSDMVVFSDANALYDPKAIRYLVRHFSDPTVGYVVGYAKYATGSNTSAGDSEGLYWNYEVRLKQWESDFHSVVGGDGALYMIRRELYQPLQVTDINDFVNPLQIIAKGYRGIFEPEAFCVEHASDSFEKEFGRKVRIVNRSFNGLLRVSELLNPIRYGRFTWLLVSHKLLRWFSPFVLLFHFILSLFLPLDGSIGMVIKTFLFFYLALAACSFCGWLADRRGRRGYLPFYLAYYFFLMNIASGYGVVKRLSGDKIATWSTVRSDEKKSHTIGANATFFISFLIVVSVVLRISFFSIKPGSAFIVEWFVFALFLLLLYTYIGYPLLLRLVRPLFKKEHKTDEQFEPTVTLLIAAYNEEAVIADKLENSLDLDYPEKKLRVLLVSDGSTDGTEAVAKQFVSRGIDLLSLSPNRGKMTALNDAFEQISSDIVIMSDANVMYQPSVVRKLVRHFVDPTVGAVSGKVLLQNDDVSYSTAENHYYNIEHSIQFIEGETGSLIGSDGAMYALRRELYPWPDPDTILDDFAISMSVVRQGKRLIHDSEAVGLEKNEEEIAFEFSRKVRIVAGGIQFLLRGKVLPPITQPFTWFKFISHKILRWFSGSLFLLLTLLTLLNYCLFPSQSWLFKVLTVGLILFWSFGFAGWLFAGLRKYTLFIIINYLMLMHVASILGVYKGLTGGQKVTWKRSEQ